MLLYTILNVKVIYERSLRELLNRCDFKDVAPLIALLYPEHKHVLGHYKESFDFLRHMKAKKSPNNPNDKISVSLWHGYKSLSDKGKDIVNVGNCEGDYWKYNLSKEIIVSDGLKLTENEIAAHCMWSLTFYGDQRTRKEVRDRIFGNIDTSNPYTVAADKLSHKLFHNYLPKQYKHADGIPWGLEPRTCRNRSKRMRDHRQEQHIKILKRKAKVEDAIRRLTADTQSFSREEVEYLFETNLICEDTYQSYSYNIDQRVEYMIDLFSDYVNTDFSKYTRFLLMIRTSQDHPLTQRERDAMQNFFNQRLPVLSEIRYGTGTDNSLGSEISLLLIGSY